jgi:MFS family permease
MRDDDPQPDQPEQAEQTEQTGQPAAPRRSRRPGWLMDTRPLQVPAYRRLWTSTIVTSVGTGLTAVAVPKQIYDDTGSSAWVGYAALAALLPLVVFALWGGAIADAVDRRKLLLVTNTGIALTSTAFFVQAVLGMQNVWVLMALLAVQQGLFGMNSPARNAAIARVVGPELLPAATSLGATVFQLGSIVGPMLAGALIPLLGLPTLYLIDAIALTAAIWAVFNLPPLPPLHHDGTVKEGRPRVGLGQVLEGFRHIATHKILMISFAADLVAMVFGMPRALFPQMANTLYSEGDGLALGVLYAAIPAGAVLGGLLSGTFTRAQSHGRMVVVAVCVWGGAVACFGLTGNLWIGCAFLMIGGAADMMSMVFRSAILQTAVTDDMRGRMQGAFTVVVAGGPRLADLLHGTAGATLGVTAAISGGGFLTIAAMLALALAVPTFLRYRAPAPAVD